MRELAKLLNPKTKVCPIEVVDEIYRAWEEDLPKLQQRLDELYPDALLASRNCARSFTFRVTDRMTGKYIVLAAEKWAWDLEETLSDFLTRARRDVHPWRH